VRVINYVSLSTICLGLIISYVKTVGPITLPLTLAEKVHLGSEISNGDIKHITLFARDAVLNI
jgi:hypothetical protein